MWQAWIYWGREGIKSTSVLLVFLSDFNLNEVAGEILLSLKKHLLLLKFCGKKNLHLKP